MAEKRVIFVIPGFGQLPTNKAYRQISKFLREEGYYPDLIKIPWNGTTISQNTEYFINRYKKIKSAKKYVLGFSYGAMVAFIAASRVQFEGLILCSLSPYFKEDIINTKFSPRSALETLRYEDFSKLESSSLAKKIKAKQVVVMYGRQEAKSLIKRGVQTFEAIKSTNKSILGIKNTDHNISDKRYLHEIHLAARNLE